MWARGHLSLCHGNWQHVVFSDESRILLYRQDCRVQVRRQVHEVLPDECALPRVQAGVGGVIICGAFHSGGKSELYVLHGNMD